MFILTVTIIGLIIYSAYSLLVHKTGSRDALTIDFKRAYYENIQMTESFSEPKGFPRYKDSKFNYKTREKKTYVGKNGYAYFLDSDKLVHRWVMEKSLGRRLHYEEVVHHIDGDKLNNRIKNLKLFSCQEEHDRYHREHLRNYGTWHEEVPEYANYKKYPEYAIQY